MHVRPKEEMDALRREREALREQLKACEEGLWAWSKRECEVAAREGGSRWGTQSAQGEKKVGFACLDDEWLSLYEEVTTFRQQLIDLKRRTSEAAWHTDCSGDTARAPQRDQRAWEEMRHSLREEIFMLRRHLFETRQKMSLQTPELDRKHQNGNVQACVERQQSLHRKIEALRRRKAEVEERAQVARWDKEALVGEMKKNAKAWLRKHKDFHKRITALTAQRTELEEEMRQIQQDNQALRQEVHRLTAEAKQVQEDLAHKVEVQRETMSVLREQASQPGRSRTKTSLGKESNSLYKRLFRKKKQWSERKGCGKELTVSQSD